MSKELKQIKADHSLSNTDIAEMCGVSNEAVKSWLYRKGTNAPEYMIRLLSFELADRQLKD